ncbi:restriction endonuclease [Streptomyces somaliensis]|uniref:BsuBI/PstI family type II restriction endonuclease n=1 Tax=Streptomyces somaliensis TaxID=78355 RepID=UPI0020CDD763|nr:BsuBI/PstI family type II restriction endonuclease [Streptomyces somaliensis]MCP9945202.1 restriction endonuclease [Streptomyces somaliensis]MCP9961583.1 restriction endonuclease [Streptomyces somaliensis]MCP9974398.1 restriction endonuclease [Streptomyces somaliensis]
MADQTVIEFYGGVRGDRLSEARQLLQLLGFDSERSNERSAYVLLALLELGPDQDWTQAERSMLRTVQIMKWLREVYDKDYAANSRETIRRFTLHQFVDAGLVVQNPDQPDRPVNSPKWCYQIEPAAFGLITSFGQEGFDERLADYLKERPGLQAMYAREREMKRIPVQLPGGKKIDLSPGGQNTLIVQIISEFCERYTPNGEVLYVGDADSKMAIFEKDSLAKLGVEVDSHGKMPDVVVFLRDRNWLVLIEAASSHGPVDAKRYRELSDLFRGSSAGLVFISALPSRVELRKYLKEIAWETDVWCADNPTHLIHFNGDRFLGPYS